MQDQEVFAIKLLVKLDQAVLYKIRMTNTDAKCFILICIFLICGCEQKPQMSGEVDVIDISASIDNEGMTMLLSEIADDITFIPLETTDECLIGRIRSICLSDNYLVIIDADPNQILLFDTTGKFVRTIGSKGQGPGEYIYPFWVALVSNELFVWDLMLNKTFCYDLQTGKYLRVKEHEATPFSMDCFNDSILIYYYSFPRGGEDIKNFTHIRTLSLDFEVTNEFWHEEFQSVMEIEEDDYQINTYSNVENIYVWDSNVENGIIFSMNKNFEKVPAYQLFFGEKYTLGRNISKKYQLSKVIETDIFLFFNIILMEERYSKRILYNKTTRKSKDVIFNLEFHDWGFHNDIDGSIPFWPKGKVSQNILYDYIIPESLKELMSHPYYETIEVKNKEKHQIIKNYLDSAEEDANPIIFLVTMTSK
jgi:hypothetical protein